jgi:hypothetical protein
MSAASKVDALSPTTFLCTLSFRMDFGSASVPSGMAVESITANPVTGGRGRWSTTATVSSICGCSKGQFCNFDDGDTGGRGSCSSFSSAEVCAENGLPTNGACDCRLRHFGVSSDSGCGSESAGGAFATAGAGIGCGILFLLGALYYNKQKNEMVKKVYQEQATTQLGDSDPDGESPPAKQPTRGGGSAAMPAPVQVVPVPVPANPVFTQSSPVQVVSASATYMSVPFAPPLPIATGVLMPAPISRLPVGAAAGSTAMAMSAQAVPTQVCSAQVTLVQMSATASGEGCVQGSGTPAAPASRHQQQAL